MCISFWGVGIQQLPSNKKEVNMKVTMKFRNTHKQKGGEKRMKHSRIIMTIGVVVSVLFAVAFIANTSTAEDVRNSKHNLTSNVTQALGTTEVCIFCHTPHGS